MKNTIKQYGTVATNINKTCNIRNQSAQKNKKPLIKNPEYNKIKKSQQKNQTKQKK